MNKTRHPYGAYGKSDCTGGEWRKGRFKKDTDKY